MTDGGFFPNWQPANGRRTKFESLRHWLATGGHEAIFHHYLHSDLELIGPGEGAPWTEKEAGGLTIEFLPRGGAVIEAWGPVSQNGRTKGYRFHFYKVLVA